VVRELRPKAFLEIGTRTGGTFFVICRLADPGATAVSLDLPGGRFGGGYGFYQIPVIRRMHKPKQQLHLIREDSHNIDTPGRRGFLTDPIWIFFSSMGTTLTVE
jgi:hypothetical protein